MKRHLHLVHTNDTPRRPEQLELLPKPRLVVDTKKGRKRVRRR